MWRRVYKAKLLFFKSRRTKNLMWKEVNMFYGTMEVKNSFKKVESVNFSDVERRCGADLDKGMPFYNYNNYYYCYILCTTNFKYSAHVFFV